MLQNIMDFFYLYFSKKLNLQFSYPGKSVFKAHAKCIISWKKNKLLRKSMPGFHPGIYSAEHQITLKERNPFIDYLICGEPKGNWNTKLILPTTHIDYQQFKDKKIALHIHSFYLDVLEEIITRLLFNRIKPDLFISVPDHPSQEKVKYLLKDYPGKIIKIEIVPNRGRDIGPLISIFGKTLIKHYEIIGHIHTKKTLFSKNRVFVNKWTYFLFENLLGGHQSGNMADSILWEMINDTKIGIVFPDDPNIMGWSKNKEATLKLSEKLGVGKLPIAINFPVGNMFWIRSMHLDKIISMNLTLDDYPEEPIPNDGTILHAIERLWGILYLTLPDSYNAVTYVPGVSR